MRVPTPLEGMTPHAILDQFGDTVGVDWLVSFAEPPHLPLLTPQNRYLDLHDLVPPMPPSCYAAQTSAYSCDVQQLCPSRTTWPALVAGLGLLAPFLHLLQHHSDALVGARLDCRVYTVM